MPRTSIDRHTRLIVEDEGWKITEYDCSSVDGLTYLSVAEEKVNAITDDLVNDIADTDKIAQYSIIVPQGTQNFTAGQNINLTYYTTKNNVVTTLDVKYTSSNKAVAKVVNGTLKAIAAGSATITVALKDDSTVTNTVSITVGGTSTFVGQISGNNTIKLSKTTDYAFVGNSTLTGSVKYKITGTTGIASIITSSTVVYDGTEWYTSTDGKVSLLANSSNTLGSFTLTALYDSVTYTKTIKVVSIW